MERTVMPDGKTLRLSASLGSANSEPPVGNPYSNLLATDNVENFPAQQRLLANIQSQKEATGRDAEAESNRSVDSSLPDSLIPPFETDEFWISLLANCRRCHGKAYLNQTAVDEMNQCAKCTRPREMYRCAKCTNDISTISAENTSHYNEINLCAHCNPGAIPDTAALNTCAKCLPNPAITKRLCARCSGALPAVPTWYYELSCKQNNDGTVATKDNYCDLNIPPLCDHCGSTDVVLEVHQPVATDNFGRNFSPVEKLLPTSRNQKELGKFYGQPFGLSEKLPGSDSTDIHLKQRSYSPPCTCRFQEMPDDVAVCRNNHQSAESGERKMKLRKNASVRDTPQNYHYESADQYAPAISRDTSHVSAKTLEIPRQCDRAQYSEQRIKPKKVIRRKRLFDKAVSDINTARRKSETSSSHRDISPCVSITTPSKKKFKDGEEGQSRSHCRLQFTEKSFNVGPKPTSAYVKCRPIGISDESRNENAEQNTSVKMRFIKHLPPPYSHQAKEVVSGTRRGTIPEKSSCSSLPEREAEMAKSPSAVQTSVEMQNISDDKIGHCDAPVKSIKKKETGPLETVSYLEAREKPMDSTSPVGEAKYTDSKSYHFKPAHGKDVSAVSREAHSDDEPSTAEVCTSFHSTQTQQSPDSMSDLREVSQQRVKEVQESGEQSRGLNTARELRQQRKELLESGEEALGITSARELGMLDESLFVSRSKDEKHHKKHRSKHRKREKSSVRRVWTSTSADSLLEKEQKMQPDLGTEEASKMLDLTREGARPLTYDVETLTSKEIKQQYKGAKTGIAEVKKDSADYEKGHSDGKSPIKKDYNEQKSKRECEAKSDANRKPRDIDGHEIAIGQKSSVGERIIAEMITSAQKRELIVPSSAFVNKRILAEPWMQVEKESANVPGITRRVDSSVVSVKKPEAAPAIAEGAKPSTAKERITARPSTARIKKPDVVAPKSLDSSMFSAEKRAQAKRSMTSEFLVDSSKQPGTASAIMKSAEPMMALRSKVLEIASTTVEPSMLSGKESKAASASTKTEKHRQNSGNDREVAIPSPAILYTSPAKPSMALSKESETTPAAIEHVAPSVVLAKKCDSGAPLITHSKESEAALETVELRKGLVKEHKFAKPSTSSSKESEAAQVAVIPTETTMPYNKKREPPMMALAGERRSAEVSAVFNKDYEAVPATTELPETSVASAKNYEKLEGSSGIAELLTSAGKKSETASTIAENAGPSILFTKESEDAPATSEPVNSSVASAEKPEPASAITEPAKPLMQSEKTFDAAVATAETGEPSTVSTKDNEVSPYALERTESSTASAKIRESEAVPVTAAPSLLSSKKSKVAPASGETAQSPVTSANSSETDLITAQPVIISMAPRTQFEAPPTAAKHFSPSMVLAEKRKPVKNSVPYAKKYEAASVKTERMEPSVASGNESAASPAVLDPLITFAEEREPVEYSVALAREVESASAAAESAEPSGESERKPDVAAVIAGFTKPSTATNKKLELAQALRRLPTTEQPSVPFGRVPGTIAAESEEFAIASIDACETALTMTEPSKLSTAPAQAFQAAPPAAENAELSVSARTALDAIEPFETPNLLAQVRDSAKSLISSDEESVTTSATIEPPELSASSAIERKVTSATLEPEKLSALSANRREPTKPSMTLAKEYEAEPLTAEREPSIISAKERDPAGPSVAPGQGYETVHGPAERSAKGTGIKRQLFGKSAVTRYCSPGPAVPAVLAELTVKYGRKPEATPATMESINLLTAPHKVPAAERTSAEPSVHSAKEFKEIALLTAEISELPVPSTAKRETAEPSTTLDEKSDAIWSTAKSIDSMAYVQKCQALSVIEEPGELSMASGKTVESTFAIGRKPKVASAVTGLSPMTSAEILEAVPVAAEGTEEPNTAQEASRAAPSTQSKDAKQPSASDNIVLKKKLSNDLAPEKTPVSASGKEKQTISLTKDSPGTKDPFASSGRRFDQGTETSCPEKSIFDWDNLADFPTARSITSSTTSLLTDQQSTTHSGMGDPSPTQSRIPENVGEVTSKKQESKIPDDTATAFSFSSMNSWFDHSLKKSTAETSSSDFEDMPTARTISDSFLADKTKTYTVPGLLNKTDIDSPNAQAGRLAPQEAWPAAKRSIQLAPQILDSTSSSNRTDILDDERAPHPSWIITKVPKYSKKHAVEPTWTAKGTTRHPAAVVLKAASPGTNSTVAKSIWRAKGITRLFSRGHLKRNLQKNGTALQCHPLPTASFRGNSFTAKTPQRLQNGHQKRAKHPTSRNLHAKSSRNDESINDSSVALPDDSRHQQPTNYTSPVATRYSDVSSKIKEPNSSRSQFSTIPKNGQRRPLPFTKEMEDPKTVKPKADDAITVKQEFAEYVVGRRKFDILLRMRVKPANIIVKGFKAPPEIHIRRLTVNGSDLFLA